MKSSGHGDSRGDALRVRDILRAAGRIHSYVHSMTKARFEHDSRTQDAVIRQLEIIGEAAKGLSPHFKEAYPVDNWRKIAGMRDKLTHHYWRADLDLVWEAAKAHARRLAAALERRRLKRKKTPAELDAEIAAMLAKSRQRRRRISR